MSASDPQDLATAIIAALDRPKAVGNVKLPPDGQIDRLEWGTASQPGFNRLDADGNEHVSFGELAAALAALPAAGREALAAEVASCAAAQARTQRQAVILGGAVAAAVAIGFGGMLAAGRWPGLVVWAAGLLVAGLVGWPGGALWLDARGRRARTALAGAVAAEVEAAGVGLDGGALAGTIVRLLDRRPIDVLMDPPRATELASPDPGRWPDGSVRERQPLGRAIDGLPPAQRQALARDVDAMVATARVCRDLVMVSFIAVWLGAGFVAFGLLTGEFKLAERTPALDFSLGLAAVGLAALLASGGHFWRQRAGFEAAMAERFGAKA